MPQTPKTKMYEAGDVFIRDDLSREYSSGSITFANATANPIALPAGTPIQGATMADAATLTAADAIVLEPIIIPPGGGKVAVYMRGTGVVINETALLTPGTTNLVVTGPSGLVTYSQANMRTMWTRLGFVYRAEPTRQDMQVK